MLRDNYKKAFSQINPSEETIERIFEMTEKKRIKRIHKGLIIAIALIAVLLCGSLTANAATDGALFEGVSLIMSGEDIDLKDYIVNHNSYVDEDGKEIEKYKFEFGDDENGGSINIELMIENEGESGTVMVYDTSVDGEDGSVPEHSPEKILELTEKIFEEFFEFKANKRITNIP